MARFKVWDESGESMLVTGAESASEAADDWVFNGDWGHSLHTRWVQVWVGDLNEDDEVIDTTGFKVEIEPEVPDCLGGHRHDFQRPLSLVGGIKENPGVRGHGGGVIIQEVCLRCGCGRQTDTWAQDPYTGEQGLTKVSYAPDAFDVSRWADDYAASDNQEDK